MAITQKQIKEQIDNAEQMIADTVKEKNELREKIKKELDKSRSINPDEDESINELYDEYSGLMSTIQYYTGSLNSFTWVLNAMKAKK